LIRNDEHEALLLLYEHLHEDDVQPGSTGDYEETWNEITKNPQILYFGAESDGELISSCHLVITPNLTRGCSPYGTIENVVCRKEYRGRGIGKGILRYALNVAWAFGCYKVMLMTGSKNEWMYKFYENAGFKRDIKTAFCAKPYR
jgi:GNAT superfamily N-acetyltransferase